jgi:iron complex transport system substrate-binding protein
MSMLAVTSLVFGLVLAQLPGVPAFADPPAALLEVVEDRGATVLVRHAYGESEVPKRPARIYSDSSVPEPLVALGIMPVGSNFLGQQSTPPDLQAQLEAAGVVLYERFASNPELILVLAPEVIIVWELLSASSDPEALYAQLSAIAPTLVMTANPYSYWREAVRDLGQVFGADSEAALASFDEAAAGYCQRLHAVIEDDSVSVLSVLARDVRLMGVGMMTPAGFIPAAPTVWLYGICGFTPAPEVARLAGTELGAIISLEELPTFAAEHIFLMSLSDEAAAPLTEHPLWPRVAAQQAGRVCSRLLGQLPRSGRSSKPSMPLAKSIHNDSATKAASRRSCRAPDHDSAVARLRRGAEQR